MLGKKISVKKLFLLLLAAILALLLLFFLHGPFLEPGVEDAVSQAVLAQVEEATDPDLVAAEGHKIFQATEEGEELVVYGVFCYGLYQVGEDQRGQRVDEGAVQLEEQIGQGGPGGCRRPGRLPDKGAAELFTDRQLFSRLSFTQNNSPLYF